MPEPDTSVNVEEVKRCGIVMPISASDGYSIEHWNEVRDIVEQSARDAGFVAAMVSDADGSHIIQKSIVQNLYFNYMVVCDVSSRNPNVMIELGMRLAFDKPMTIIKDDQTPYPFDTSNIQYLEYRKDLRHASVVLFKDRLSKTLSDTSKQVADQKYHSFIRTFGDFKVPQLSEVTVSSDVFIIEKLEKMQASIERLQTKPALKRSPSRRFYKLQAPTSAAEMLDLFRIVRRKYPGIDIMATQEGEYYIVSFADDELDASQAQDILLTITSLERKISGK